jgi:hypothetical protein
MRVWACGPTPPMIGLRRLARTLIVLSDYTLVDTAALNSTALSEPST